MKNLYSELIDHNTQLDRLYDNTNNKEVYHIELNESMEKDEIESVISLLQCLDEREIIFDSVAYDDNYISVSIFTYDNTLNECLQFDIERV